MPRPFEGQKSLKSCILGHGEIVNILRSGVGGQGFARSVPTPSTVRISELF